jgi:hypothetical protein
LNPKVDVQIAKQRILGKLWDQGDGKIREMLDTLVCHVIGEVEEDLRTDNVLFSDALHPEVHNTIMAAVEECIEFSLQAWNDEDFT